MTVSTKQLAQTFQVNEQELIEFAQKSGRSYGLFTDELGRFSTTTMFSGDLVEDFKNRPKNKRLS